jgi:hypothetical protein
MYLGDGCVVTTRDTAAWLVITLDAAYPGIVIETATPWMPASRTRPYGNIYGAEAAWRPSR